MAVTSSTTGSKPSILIVDDHPGVLDKVAALLADDYHVAGLAPDGFRAIAMASQLAPDAIVLDINMPGLDGFQTKAALDHAGSTAPVVFLSMLGDDEHVTEAFRRGARGYVVKPNIARDLGSALHHVLLGQRFVPSLESLFQVTPDGGHAVQRYGDDPSFVEGLARFFDLALRRGDATCVISTPAVRHALADRLRMRGWNVEGASNHPRYLVVDANDALDRCMRNGRPDGSILAEIASELDAYRVAVSEGATSRLTIFGNMSGVLAAAGNAEGATALEHAWTSLTQDLPFFTLCGYSGACLHDSADLWSGVCAAHSAVSHAS